MHTSLISVACTQSQYLVFNYVKQLCAHYLPRVIKNPRNFRDYSDKLRWQPRCFPIARWALSLSFLCIHTHIYLYICKLPWILSYLGWTLQPCLTAPTSWSSNMHRKENIVGKLWPSRQLCSMVWAAYPSRLSLETLHWLSIITGSISADINKHDTCFVWQPELSSPLQCSTEYRSNTNIRVFIREWALSYIYLWHRHCMHVVVLFTVTLVQCHNLLIYIPKLSEATSGHNFLLFLLWKPLS